MSDTNRVELYYIPESTWGTTPASALKALRYAGEGLGQASGSILSNEITATRDVADIVRTEINAEGDVNGEISYGTLDDLLAGALYTTAEADVATSASLTAVASGNKYTRSTGSFATDGWKVGKRGRAAGFTTPGNNGYFWVTAVSALELTISGLTLADEGPVSVTLDNDGMFRNGTTFKSFSLEKKFADLSNIYHAFRGMCVGTMNLNVGVGAISTWSVGFQGKKQEALGATIGTGGPTAANSNAVLNAVDNVTAIYEGGTLATLDINTLSLNMNNNLRVRRAIGSAEAIGIGVGRMTIEGTMNAYFEDNALLTKYLNFTETSLSFRLIDSAGQAIVCTLPAIKPSNCRVLAGGLDTDVMVELTFQCKRDATSGCMVQFDMFDAPV